MKKFSLLLCSAVLCISAFTQQPDYCGTTMPDDMRAWLKNYKLSGRAMAQKQESAVQYIPLKIHIVGNDQAGGYYKISNLLDVLCKLNEDYIPVGFHFYIYGDLNYINNSDLYEHSGFNVTSIVNQTKTRNVANIYFVQDPAGNCGYFSGWGDYVAIAKSCASPNSTTVSHELGHYFSLPHTFSGWEGRSPSDPAEAGDERANGSNCVTAGDNFCDTPADYISNRWSCPYNNAKLDFTGTPYNVDGSLFMSYANDACQDKFSPEQIDAMQAYLSGTREYLLNYPPPVADSVGETANLFPLDGSATVPANYVQLKWKKAAGATHYNLQVTRYFNGNFSNIDMVTQDTSVLITNLEPSYNYRWRVRPYNQGNTCSSYTPYSNFITRDSTSIVPSFTVSAISCPGEDDGTISIGISGGTGPYSLNWSNGANGQTLFDLDDGNYMLTITDASSDSLVLSFDIVEPKPLNAQIEQNNYVLNAEVAGGTPPFNYHWSNNVTVPQITMNNPGEYSVTITDSKGCSTTKSFFFTSVQTISAATTRIYPNPAQHGEMLTVEFSARESFSGTIELLDNTGRRVSALEKTFVSGKNQESVSLPSLAQGIYILRIAGDGVEPFNRKLAVY